MDKKGAIAVAIAMAVMIIWQLKFAPKPTPPLPQPAQASASASPAASAAPAMPATETKPVQPTEQAIAESVQKVTTPSAEYAFTNLGGGISRAVLSKYPAENGNVTMNEFGSLPIGAISERAGEAATQAYTVSAKNSEVICERTEPNGLQIVKRFSLPESTKNTEEYSVKLNVDFMNRGAQTYQSSGWFIYVGSAAPIHQRDLPMFTRFIWQRSGKASNIDVNWFSAGRFPLLGFQTRPERPVYAPTASVDNLDWAGVRSQYFTTIIVPEQMKGNALWATRFPAKSETRDLLAVQGAMGLPGFSLKPGETHSETFSIYAGPTVYHTLRKLGHGEEAALDLGMFKPVAVFLLNSMNSLHSFLKSYALSIIVLTLCIKGILWPLQNRATASMKKMQALQPKMTELREKYKDDPTRMNEELMKLYKTYGVNPFGGCLPMLIQLPIFFGLFAVLRSAIELRGSHFLWVHDLSQPDTIAQIAGIPINLLPLCMAGTNVWMMQLTPKSGDQTQQRMMVFMPLIFLFICYNFASALSLYYTVQNLFTIVQLYVTRSQTAPVLQKVALPRKKKP